MFGNLLNVCFVFCPDLWKDLLFICHLLHRWTYIVLQSINCARSRFVSKNLPAIFHHLRFSVCALTYIVGKCHPLTQSDWLSGWLDQNQANRNNCHYFDEEISIQAVKKTQTFNISSSFALLQFNIQRTFIYNPIKNSLESNRSNCLPSRVCRNFFPC